MSHELRMSTTDVFAGDALVINVKMNDEDTVGMGLLSRRDQIRFPFASP